MLRLVGCVKHRCFSDFAVDILEPRVLAAKISSAIGMDAYYNNMCFRKFSISEILESKISGRLLKYVNELRFCLISMFPIFLVRRPYTGVYQYNHYKSIKMNGTDRVLLVMSQQCGC